MCTHAHHTCACKNCLHISHTRCRVTLSEPLVFKLSVWALFKNTGRTVHAADPTWFTGWEGRGGDPECSVEAPPNRQGNRQAKWKQWKQGEDIAGQCRAQSGSVAALAVVQRLRQKGVSTRLFLHMWDESAYDIGRPQGSEGMCVCVCVRACVCVCFGVNFRLFHWPVLSCQSQIQQRVRYGHGKTEAGWVELRQGKVAVD